MLYIYIYVFSKLSFLPRYLGGGASMHDLHIQYRIGHSTISLIVREVCSAIWNEMKSKCFPELTPEFWLNTAAEFMARTNFPHCLGALDGKHIRVIKPTDSGSLNFNYKKFFSILLLAICDDNYKFLFVDVGAYGKSSDSTVFKMSVFQKKLLDSSLNIPKPRNVGVGVNENLPFMFVADEGFGQSQFILRPYGGKCWHDSGDIYLWCLKFCDSLLLHPSACLALLPCFFYVQSRVLFVLCC